MWLLVVVRDDSCWFIFGSDHSHWFIVGRYACARRLPAQLLVDDLNFSIPPGSVVGIIGGNGAGQYVYECVCVCT